MQDEKIIRGYDSRIMKRLFRYVKPYRFWFFLAVFGLILATAAELMTPVIMQRTIDNHILVSFLEVFPGKAADEEVRLSFSGNEIRIGERTFLNVSHLGEISGDEKEHLRNGGVIGADEWYLFTAVSGGEFENILAEHSDLFIIGNGYAGISKENLEELSSGERIIIRKQDLNGLRANTMIYLGLLAIVLLFSFLQVYIMAFISQGVMRDMRMELLDHTIGQPLSFLNTRPVGSLVSRVTSDVETVNELFTSVATSLFRDVFVMAGVIFVLFTLNTRLALITVLSIPPVFVLTLIFRSRAREAFRQVRQWVSNVNSFLSEHISGMEIVQMFGKENSSREEFSEKNGTLLKANLREMYVFAAFRPMIDLFTSISTGLIIYFGARLFSESTLTLGVLIAFVNLIGQFYRPVMDIAEKFNILQSAMAGSERVFDLLDSKEALPDEGKALNAEGLVEFRDVRFRYNDDEEVLKGLSFRIEPGETVAVVGYTGAGKTTIANLMTRFWDIQSGSILLDGKDIREYSLDSLRSHIQTVQQDVFLFSGTLEENIALGKRLSREELERAASTVQADKFIGKLTDGYGTEVKEGGANFSAGQRQLISFARIIAHNPRVIILDEATASIDTETEKLIQLAMDELLRERTSLVIAHRLSTIRNADRILVLNEGQLVEEGTHDELMNLQGSYYNLYRLQYERDPLG